MGERSSVQGSLGGELRRLEDSWRRFWPGSETEAMAADVAARVRTAVEAWGLEDVESLSGGRVALVCGAVRAGRQVVLKVRPRGHEEEGAMAGEAAALAAWEGSAAAVPLLGVRDDDLTLLLERLSPGTPLDATAVDGMERLRILGTVAARLHAAGLGGRPGISGMDEYCAAWRRDLIGSAADLAELDALLAGPADEAVLHGDLHGGNVLLHQGAWVAIDPHAVYGDRNAEIWSLIDPLSPVLGGDSEMARVALSTFASAAELDPARAARWTRLRATAESEAINRSAEASDEERVWAEKMQRFAAALGS